MDPAEKIRRDLADAYLRSITAAGQDPATFYKNLRVDHARRRIRAYTRARNKELTAAGYQEWMHPRGRNGRWINKFGFYRIRLAQGAEGNDTDGPVSRYAQVKDFTEDGVVVELAEPGSRVLNGKTITVLARDLTPAPQPVARLGNDMHNQPITIPEESALIDVHGEPLKVGDTIAYADSAKVGDEPLEKLNPIYGRIVSLGGPGKPLSFDTYTDDTFETMAKDNKGTKRGNISLKNVLKRVWKVEPRVPSIMDAPRPETARYPPRKVSNVVGPPEDMSGKGVQNVEDLRKVSRFWGRNIEAVKKDLISKGASEYDAEQEAKRRSLLYTGDVPANYRVYRAKTEFKFPDWDDMDTSAVDSNGERHIVNRGMERGFPLAAFKDLLANYEFLGPNRTDDRDDASFMVYSDKYPGHAVPVSMRDGKFAVKTVVPRKGTRAGTMFTEIARPGLISKDEFYSNPDVRYERPSEPV